MHYLFIFNGCSLVDREDLASTEFFLLVEESGNQLMFEFERGVPIVCPTFRNCKIGF